ncbi:MAG TPA: cysteine peptidase family C39 domain-containing protein [Chloroflexota bacterium]|nr:cysteine peptidase family C39 domain-containing protein [Chloroflexota bacterium]
MNVPHFEQELSYSCLPACVRMVVAYYGRDISEAELRTLLKTRISGTSPVQVMLRLPEIGFDAVVQTASLSVLQQHLENGRPCIVHVWTELLPHWQDSVIHAATIVELTESHVLINDPAFSNASIMISREVFFQAWSATDHMMLVIQPYNK